MYFPIIRGKRHDLDAVIAAAPALLRAGNVMPIIEPVRPYWADIAGIADLGLPIGLVSNPLSGIYSPPHPRSQRVMVPIPRQATQVYRHAFVRPTLYVTSRTTTDYVRRYHNRLAGRAHFMFIRSRPQAAGLMERLHATPPAGFLLSVARVRPQPPRALGIDVSDPYRKRYRNADYPRDEPFSLRLTTIGNDPNFSSFGDYSIVGRPFKNGAGGNGTNNVALHLVYSVAGRLSELRIRHYVSGRGALDEMCREALALLVNDLPDVIAHSGLNETPTVRELRAIHAAGGHLSLGEGKAMAIRHHLELMTVVQ